MVILSDNFEYEQKLKNSIEKVSNFVLSTYGPFGQNVLINRNGKSFLTKDGVTVAKAVTSNDPIESAIIDIIKQTAESTVRDAGDGPQPLYSKVLTPNGFIEIGNLKIGDKICGTNNTIQEVVGIFPKGIKRIYKLKFSDNRIVECCLDHLWTVTTHYGAKKTLTVKKLIESGIKTKTIDGHYNYKYYTPSTSVDFYNQNLILDPFLVGLLIGDGCLCDSGSIELSLSLDQEYILEKLILPENIKYSYTKNYDKNYDKNYLRVKFSRKNEKGPTMHHYINIIGLLNKKSKEKFIPKQYLYSSFENRKKLLEGLYESDGYINKRGLFEYSTVSRQLHDDVLELLRSMGKNVYSRLLKRKKDSSYSDTPIYRIHELKGYKHGVKLIDIEETDQYTEMVCIKVSNDDNLYITDNYIITHNTTSSILFLTKFINEIKNLLKVTNQNDITPSKVKECFEIIFNKLFIELQRNSKEISSKEDLYNIAYMASNGDKLISELISDLIDQVGVSGSAHIKNSKTGKTYLQFIEGMKFKSAVASTVFLNDLQQKKTLNDCVIVISNVQIEFSEDLLHLLSNCVADKKAVLFICPSMDEKSLTTIVANVSRGSHLSCAVLYPSYLGQEKLEVFEDIALLCGTTVNTTKYVNRTSPAQWGYCKSVELTKTDCLLSEANASPALLDKTVAALKAELQASEDDNANKRLEARISRLTSVQGVVYVGGNTEAEIIEKRHRIEDALESCQSAIKKGIIEGGGVGLRWCVDNVGEEINQESFLDKMVYGIIFRACCSVTDLLYGKRTFASYKDGKIFRILDLRKNRMVDAFEDGIIESVWTVQCALKNAFSAAWVLCQTSSAIIEINKEV